MVKYTVFHEHALQMSAIFINTVTQREFLYLQVVVKLTWFFMSVYVTNLCFKLQFWLKFINLGSFAISFVS